MAYQPTECVQPDGQINEYFFCVGEVCHLGAKYPHFDKNLTSLFTPHFLYVPTIIPAA